MFFWHELSPLRQGDWAGCATARRLLGPPRIHQDRRCRVLPPPTLRGAETRKGGHVRLPWVHCPRVLPLARRQKMTEINISWQPIFSNGLMMFDANGQLLLKSCNHVISLGFLIKMALSAAIHQEICRHLWVWSSVTSPVDSLHSARSPWVAGRRWWPSPEPWNSSSTWTIPSVPGNFQWGRYL